MKGFFLFIQLVLSIGLITLILLQSGKGGLSGGVGGDTYRTKRGAEMLIFKATIGLAILFFITSIVNLLLK